MAIQFNRNSKSKIGLLKNGEPFVSTDTGELFFGVNGKNKRVALDEDIKELEEKITGPDKKVQAKLEELITKIQGIREFADDNAKKKLGDLEEKISKTLDTLSINIAKQIFTINNEVKRQGQEALQMATKEELIAMINDNDPRDLVEGLRKKIEEVEKIASEKKKVTKKDLDFNKIFQEFEKRYGGRPASLNHRHKISDVTGLEAALANAGGGGSGSILPWFIVGSTQTYKTVQSAVTAAQSAGGGVVYIENGTYTENVVISANNIHLVGETVDGVVLKRGDSTNADVVEATGSLGGELTDISIRNLTIDGNHSNNTTLYSNVHFSYVEDVVIDIKQKNAFKHGIDIDHGKRIDINLIESRDCGMDSGNDGVAHVTFANGEVYNARVKGNLYGGYGKGVHTKNGCYYIDIDVVIEDFEGFQAIMLGSTPGAGTETYDTTVRAIVKNHTGAEANSHGLEIYYGERITVESLVVDTATEYGLNINSAEKVNVKSALIRNTKRGVVVQGSVEEITFDSVISNDSSVYGVVIQSGTGQRSISFGNVITDNNRINVYVGGTTGEQDGITFDNVVTSNAQFYGVQVATANKVHFGSVIAYSNGDGGAGYGFLFSGTSNGVVVDYFRGFDPLTTPVQNYHLGFIAGSQNNVVRYAEYGAYETGDMVDNGTNNTVITSLTAGSGDVVGPASSTDNSIARFDSTTGKLLQNSTVTIGDTGNVNLNGTGDIRNGIDGDIALQVNDGMSTEDVLKVNGSAKKVQLSQETSAGFVKTDASGNLTGGESVEVADITDLDLQEVWDASADGALTLGSGKPIVITGDGNTVPLTINSNTNALFDLYSSNAGASVGFRIRNGNTNWSIGHADAVDNFEIGEANALPGTNTRLSIEKSTGNVGIGHNAPTEKLDVEGGKTKTAASTTSYASLELPSGDDPSAPDAGDMWFNGTNLNFYDGSSTTDLLAGGGGGGASYPFFSFSTDFGDISNRYTTSAGNGGTVTLSDTFGAFCDSNATANGYARFLVNPRGVTYFPSFQPFNKTIVCSFWVYFINVTLGTNSTYSQVHILGNPATRSTATSLSASSYTMGLYKEANSSTDAIYVYTSDGTTLSVSSDISSAFTDNQFAFVTFEFTPGTDLKVYVDDVLQVTKTTNLPSTNNINYIMSAGVWNETSSNGDARMGLGSFSLSMY